ncbi:SMP-30/gluconolactonase/LRE family protein [Qipengyuania citrea]|uniref:SMP-30/gluconolactonase/LRE family protein n=1 Tax=Qipengyuania citrea TaxID=225971 RepID=A0ABY4U1T4_9SPHN|nr:SMP-30/gluconolactonase/LRE family protein [Qipengyuania citrea]USA60066.1 SMP-30/gluconolactonase/LRE family protein [Qipengyuania citrea]
MECVSQVGAVLGEGPTWVAREQAVYWVDIPERKLFRWSDVDGTRVIRPGYHVCSILPRQAGGFVGGGYDGFLALASDWSMTSLGEPEPDLPNNRFNDGKIDRAGRLWAGTMDRHEQQASGALYRLDPDLRWSLIDSGYRVTNGPAFSLDGRTMYHTDSALQRVYAFDLDERGEVSRRRVFAQFAQGDGYPDGMTVDAHDCLWIAFWDGWCLRRLSPEGVRLQEIRLPVQRPTSCAFGGPALDRLFVTSARRDLPPEALEQQPFAGGLLRLDPGVAGVAEAEFVG